MLTSTGASLSPFRHRRSVTGAMQRVLRGVVFDMDGTLTVPCLDFVEMRRRVGVATGDVLHVIDTWSPTLQRKAYDTIKEMELEALDKLQIMPGARALCEFLDTKKVRRGLITRNVQTSVDHFHRAFGLPEFQPALSREFRPYKPDPDPLLHICNAWGVLPCDVLMIGDSAKDDIVCGKRAGSLTCLVDWLKNFPEVEALPDEHRPDLRVETLMEVKTILEEQFDLQPTHPAPVLTASSSDNQMGQASSLASLRGIVSDGINSAQTAAELEQSKVSRSSNSNKF